MRRFALSFPGSGRSSGLRALPPQSFDALVLPHLDGAYNLARFLTRDPALSEDAVQDAMVRAFRSFDQFRGDSPRAWLFAIVRNCCRSAMTSRNASGLHLISETDSSAEDNPNRSDDPEQALMRACDAAMVRDMVAALPEPFREAIVLRDLEELSYREIAEVTGVAMGTVMSRISRGRAMIAEQLSGRDGSAKDRSRTKQ